MSQERPLEGRIAVVTGATRGIGFFASRALAEAGAHIVALGRTQGALEELDDEIRKLGSSATLVPLDLTDGEGIDRLGAAINERWGKLDIFLANAGTLGTLSPLGHVKAKDWDQVMAINVTANWRLLRTLDPVLQRSDAGRAIFISSGVAHNIKAFWGPYAVSKAALETIARTYAQENQKSPIKVAIVNPGPMRTAMRARAMPGEDPQTLPHPSELAPYLVEMASPAFERNDQLFSFPTKTWLDFRAPA